MLERQILFKRLQEMQHQRQLQELSDARQQNYLNQLTFLNKQTSAGLHSPLINGMPVHDASQMFIVGNMHLTQHGTSPVIQGVPNGLVFSQAQNQATYSSGVLPQQFDTSLYGTPVASSGINMNSFSCIQGASHGSTNMLNRGNNSQLEIPVMQPSTVSSSFVNEQFNAPRKVCSSDGNFVPKNVFQDKNIFGQLLQASDDGVLPAKFHQLHALQRNTTMKESGIRQEQAGWPILSAGKISNIRPSHCETSLDPLEERILFNTDDNSWESILGRQSNGGLTGFVSTGEHLDFMGTFSSNQSGSWSALMQSAVAEASSSDTGQQEEWSGLTFQNPDSADNQHYIGDGKISSWVDNNLQSISSPTSKPEVLFQNSNTNYSFPIFQESSHHVIRQKEGMNSDTSHESVLQYPKNSSQWFDSNLQQRQTIEGCHALQNPQSENSKNDRHQPSISPYAMSSQSGNRLTGDELKANEWLHESGPQPMVSASLRPPDQMYLADFQRNLRASQDLPPRNNIDSIAAIFDSPADFCGRGMISHESGNMLNLLNKTDKPSDLRTGMHLGCKDESPLSEVPQIENCNLSYNPSTTSQGLGLGLSPSSQQIPKSYSALGFPIVANSSLTNSSVPLHMNNQNKNQHHPVTYHTTVPAITGAFQGQEIPTFGTLPVTQPSLISGVPHQIGLLMGPPNMSHDVPSQPDVLQLEMPNVFSNSFCSPDAANCNVDAPRGSLHEQYEQNTLQTGDNIREINACSRRTQAYDCAEDHAVQLNSSGASTPFGKNLSAANATTSVSTTEHHQEFGVEQRVNNTPDISWRDLDAFGSSVRPHFLQKNFLLPHQQVNANARQQMFRGLKPVVTNLAQGDPNAKSELNSISYCDNKPMSSLSEASKNLPGKHSSKTLIQDGGMLPMYGLMHRMDAGKQFSDGKSLDTFQVISSIGQVNPSISGQPSSILPNSATKIVANQLSSPFLMPLDNTERNSAILRPKKRKVSAFDLLPWHKEVAEASQQAQKVSSIAESEWAIASNQLSERVADEAKMMDDALPMPQAKKRLVLTTQLMQQVFRPAPAVILSADACSNSESMVYFIARLALRDACSMTTGFQKPFLTTDMSSKNLGTSERVGRLDFSEAVKNFIDRAKRIENDLLRLDKTASIVDINVDSQELEKFSVINRFAKFHSRGHLVSVNTSSASGANPAVLKASLQKYVVAHPIPNVVPEGTNCISL